jgi:hypothetical protein
MQALPAIRSAQAMGLLDGSEALPPQNFFFETRQKALFFTGIGEKSWLAYKENWPKTVTT